MQQESIGLPVTRHRAAPWLRHGIWLIIILFLLLSIIYSLATPIFEASDELSHYPYVHYLVTEHRLPVQDPDDVQLWVQEGGQPPLYYLVAALGTFWIDAGDLAERRRNNPHAKIGIPMAPDNKNIVVHAGGEGFPYRGTELAVRLIRLFSILMASGTVLLTYLIAREVLPESILLALVAAAVTAFNPMFLFISASVNNDNLAVLLCSLALLLMVRLIRTGVSPGRVAVLGLVVGLAALTKLSALGLLGLAAAVITWDAWRRRSWRAWLQNGLVLTGLVLAIAGWWYLRNWLLYQDPLGFSVWLEIAGARRRPLSPARLLAEFEGFRISYWGLFGVVNVLMHPLLYKFYDLLTLLAMGGWVLAGGRWLARVVRGGKGRPRVPGHDPRLVQMALLALWLVILVVLLIRWTWLTPASQGRLIFPGMAAASFWLAYGWRSLLPQRWRPAALGAVAASLLLVAAVVPFAFIAPVYAQPPMVESLPAGLETVEITYGDRFELVAYGLAAREVHPGQSLVMELGWRALAPMEDDYSIFVHLYGPDGNLLGQADTYPGGGLLPTSHWAVGDQYVERIEVPVARDAEAPSIGRVVVGLYLHDDATMLSASDPGGADLGTGPTLARFKVAPYEPLVVDIPEPAGYQLGPKLSLLGYDLSAAPGEVTLYWQAGQPVSTDYTVFVHLLDAAGDAVAQADSQPQAGAYPTSFWSVHEIVPDRHLFPAEAVAGLLPGTYTLRVGLYDLQTGVRLPVSQAGVDQGDQVVLGPIRVP
jgi:4-amino-4-deoxy-L-arabinose transferase-like glycosyltransferase